MAARGDGKGSSPAPRGAMAAAAMSFTAVPLTLYPDMFPGPLGHSMAGRALESGLWSCAPVQIRDRSEEHTSELQSLMRISYAVLCLKKKNKKKPKEQR